MEDVEGRWKSYTLSYEIENRKYKQKDNGKLVFQNGSNIMG